MTTHSFEATKLEEIKTRLLAVMINTPIAWTSGVKFHSGFVKSDNEGKCALCDDNSKIVKVCYGVPPTEGYDHLYHLHELPVAETDTAHPHTNIFTQEGDPIVTRGEGVVSEEVAELLTNAPTDILFLLHAIEVLEKERLK